MPKLVAFEDFRAPWETEAGADTEIDKPKLKRYLYGLLSDKEKSQTRADEVTVERDKYKEQIDAEARKGESESDKLKRENQELKDKLAKPPGESVETLKLRVALDKNLTAFQAKRLVGNTKEELEADADEILKAWGGTGQGGDEGDEGEEGEEGEGTPPTRQPRRLRNPANNGQGSGGNQEIDITKAVAGIPRINSF